MPKYPRCENTNYLGKQCNNDGVMTVLRNFRVKAGWKKNKMKEKIKQIWRNEPRTIIVCHDCRYETDIVGSRFDNYYSDERDLGYFND